VLVFLSKLIWQQARNSLLDAKFGSTNPAMQQSVQNSIGDDPEFLCKRQFTRINVAAEEGDHIARELIHHQGACHGACEPPLVACTWIIFLQSFGDLLITLKGFRKPHFFGGHASMD
jgi:hypothetical protein